MASEGTPKGGGTAVSRLAALLTAAGRTPPTPLELAEVLWLARQLEERQAAGEHRETDGTTTPARPDGRDRAPDPPAAPSAGTRHGDDPAALTPATGPAPPAADRVPLHLPAPAPPSSAPSPGGPGQPGGGTPLLAPAPPMLPRPLALQRALRPLKRTVPSAHARLLDERATADRIARSGARPDVWLPVLRPARERWLRLNLVHDTGPTMPVWRPLVRELHTVLAQSGIFRTVTLHPAGPDGRARHVPDPADGRTVTLVVSDCMGPQWRPGPAGDRWYRTLRHWAARMPLAVVQPLPEHLWPTTALPAEPGVLSSPSAAAPPTALTFTPYDPDAARPPAAVPLPVLEPGAPWLAHWATLLAAPGGARTPGAAAWLPPRPTPPPPADAAPDPASLSARDLVLRFRATASPEAFRLAGHLALALPSVPVMRLVQRAVDRDPRPQHLAEVILSGMLTAVPGPPGSYDFRPGVRDLLLRTLPRTARGRTRELLDRVGGLIDERAGLAAGEFRARTADGNGPGDGRPFATVSEETVRRLGGGGEAVPRPADEAGAGLIGGRYRLLGRRGPGQRMWRAVDTRTGEPVVVHRYPEQPAPRERFLREARTLAEVDDPHVVRIRDFGVEGDTPYLVAEFVEGVTLTELLEGSGPGVSFPVFARLVCDVTAGLGVLHRRGLVRGQEGGKGLLLRPDGTVLISRFALGEEARGRSAASDTAAFDRLLRELAPQVPAVPPRFRSLLARIAQGTVPSSAPAELAAARDTAPLHLRMLGPLRIGRATEPGALPSPEAQALLCMLVLRPGQRMTHDELAAGLWDRPPGPRPARRRIGALATELRRHLGPGTLATTSDGYALYAPGAYVDALACEDVLTHHSPDRDPQRRRVLLDNTLALFRGEPLEGVPGPAAEATRARLRDLHRTLESELAALGPDRNGTSRPTLLFHTDTDLGSRPEARISLEYAVHQVLDRGDLTPQQYEVRVRPDGYRVDIAPGAYLLPVLAAALHWLPGPLSDLADPPRLRVTFQHGDGPQATEPPEPPEGTAPVLVLVPPALYEAFADSSAASGPYRFRPLYGGAPDAPPVAWYCPLAGPRAEDEERDLVRGPFITRDLGELGIPAPGRTAVVHTRADGPLTLLDPAQPHGGRPPRLTTYYEVDLAPHHAVHQLSLPSSGKGDFTAVAELSWRVADPVAFVRSDTARVSDRLLAHLLETAPRITRRHSLRRAAGAQRAVNTQVGRWPVPGLAVTCEVRLTPEGAPATTDGSPGRRPPTPAGLLGEAETVLLGFDGPLTRLFTATTARAAARDLLALAAEHRDPQDALTGRPLAVAAARESVVHPLDVLRVFARDPLGPFLRGRLNTLELRAVPDAPTTHNSVALVRALHAAGRRVAVVADVCEEAVHRYLEPYRLPLAGTYGRGEDLTLLTPHPDCLLRALRDLAASAATGVLIGSSVAELTAAQRIGLRFIGLARNPTVEQELREAGCEVTVRSLAPVLEAARAL
ncbi:SAV_2336 N-terminal domain-related protein [Streptomyces sp. NPDC014995]|uniref:SAV_2336 N-terminal domain-related protein n=1 Tax=Streptomyces sp. NPDC014995 TaxID=3364936 RepID=UPI0036FF274F